MKKITVYFLFFSFYLLSIISAAPYTGQVYSFKQPDGTYVNVKLYGDENYINAESLKGHSLIVDPQTKVISFAGLSTDEKALVSTGIAYNDLADNQADKNGLRDKAGRLLNKHLHINREALQQIISEKNSKRQYQRINLSPAISSFSALGITSGVNSVAGNVAGNYKGLLLLIDFPDDRATITRTQVDNFANQLGYTEFGNNGSVRDYFRDVSNNKLDYTNYVTEYYTALHNKSYYSDPTRPYSQAAQELISEALIHLRDVDFFDFSTLSNANGYISAINVFYAGQCKNNWAQGLWPHSSGMGYYTFTANGLSAGDYQISYMKNSSGVDEMSLGVICHENGHMLMHWPDLYDYAYDSCGMGYYDLMGYGCTFYKNPTPPSAYLRDLAGWETILGNLNSSSMGTFNLNSNTASSYKFINPENTKEAFYIESRQKIGRSSNLPDSGLMICHIDQNGCENNQQMTNVSHYLVSIEEADGQFHLENNSIGTSQNLYKEGYITSFDNTTVPSSNWWNSTLSGLNIVNVGPAGNTMYFTMGIPTATGTVVVTGTYTNLQPEKISATATQTNTSTITETATITPILTPVINGNNKSFSYPNPFVKSKTFQMKFAFKQASSVKIEIYNVSLLKIMELPGSEIFASQGMAVWEVKDYNGKSLPFGIYFAVVTSDKEKTMIKFSVIE